MSAASVTYQQQQDKINNAMRMFTYFEEWNDTTLKECCTLSKMKVFSKDQTILGDGMGLQNYVYFITSGSCQVIEHLLVTVDVKNGIKRYKLYSPSLPTNIPTINVEDKEAELLNTELKKEEEIPEVVIENETAEKFVTLAEVVDAVIKKTKLADDANVTDGDLIVENKENSSIRIEDCTEGAEGDVQKSATEYTATVKAEKGKEITLADNDKQINTALKSVIPEFGTNLLKNVETHFMQVCFLNATACFGIGENMNNRRIIARTKTECLLIPRIWLLQKNAGNIWVRVQQFLNNHIPTTKQVFQEFFSQRRWLTYRKKTINKMLAKRKVNFGNVNSNIPYCIRIHEEID